MRYGVIDLGSNTVRLVVYDIIDQNNFKKVYSRKEVVGLASYLLPEGYLSDMGILRAIEVVKELKEDSESYQTDKLFLIATATVRNARNQNEIVNRIHMSTGVKVTLLSGLEEASVGVLGIKHEFDFKEGVVIDIGGGSTEVSTIFDKKVDQAASLPVGSLNAYITYVKDMLPTESEIKSIKKGVIHALEQAEIKRLKMNVIYGIGGTLKAAKALYEGMMNKHLDYLTKENILHIMRKIDPTKKSTYLNLIRLVPERFHTIMPGLVILETIFEYFDAERLYIGKNGIREGYILSQMKKKA
ncbi:hypothetical protein JV173_06835 [Acholeplasma equirhinis]|uniref:Ppx/GppA phosphatase family protein n=1 Tax=Acholeplasma equirhinis TaxID=555393 RepID=UPI00197A8B9E|nr:hypothetical protein [Acholeplasma equirhinis]MBN3491215.1 hypothetical protein [Acholeplasma equirhinis]